MGSHSHVLSLLDVPTKSGECLYMSTLCLQCNWPILLMWGRRTGTGLGLPTLGSLGKALGKGPLLPLPPEGKWALGLTGQGYTEKKHLLKSSIIWYPPRTLAKNLRQWHSCINEEVLLCSVISIPLLSAMSHQAFLLPKLDYGKHFFG